MRRTSPSGGSSALADLQLSVSGICSSHTALRLSIRGLEAVKRCSRVYLEAYTSILMVPKERLVRAPVHASRATHSRTAPWLACLALFLNVTLHSGALPQCSGVL